MKLFQAVLFASSSLWATADNTPNLCTDDIPNLTKIRPSVTANHTIPDIKVGSSTYSGDAEHFVVRPPLENGRSYERVLVYIPGTTDRPELSSCLIRSAANTLEDVPVLALSYQYLSSGDKFRNGKCAMLGDRNGIDAQVDCLTQQHVDAIEGGDYGATTTKDDGTPFWDEVLHENSLKQRLGELVSHLHGEYPTEGWDKFLVDGPDPFTIKWDDIIVSGHSQGAGHAAYLAKTESLRGVVMISGPQDSCHNSTGPEYSCPEGTTFWIDEGPYVAENAFYTALGHGNEPLFPVMQDNWARMKAADPSINWEVTDTTEVGFALETTAEDACNAPLQTNVAYAETSTCGGKDHCSTAIDDTVPFIETFEGEKYYLYENSVWPSLLNGAGENKPCPRSTSSNDNKKGRKKKGRNKKHDKKGVFGS